MLVHAYQDIFLDSLDDEVHLHAIGDWHLGVLACAEKSLVRAIQGIAEDPYALALGMGDYGDFIEVEDRRWDPMQFGERWHVKDLADMGTIIGDAIVSASLPLAGEEIRDDNGAPILVDLEGNVIEDFSLHPGAFYPKRVGGRWIGMLHGNHENSWMRHQGRGNFMRDICGRLNTRWLGYSAKIRLRFIEKESGEFRDLRIFASHGASTARTRNGKRKALEDLMQGHIADLYLMGHVHMVDFTDAPALDADYDKGKVVAVERMGAITGTYLRTYVESEMPTYGEMKLYPPVPLGHPRIDIVPRNMSMTFKKVRA